VGYLVWASSDRSARSLNQLWPLARYPQGLPVETPSTGTVPGTPAALAAWYFGSYADEVSFWHSHDFEEDADEKGWEAVQISANKRTREQHKAGASDGTR
jgi:hypothetical protein